MCRTSADTSGTYGNSTSFKAASPENSWKAVFCVFGASILKFLSTLWSKVHTPRVEPGAHPNDLVFIKIREVIFSLKPWSQSRIAYRLQEFQFGGLSKATEELLESMANADPLANLQNVPSRNYSNTRGTRFVREWRGREYVVTVLGPKQFEYDNEMFTSLTAVATKITGTHQSGKSFFGVKK